MNDGLTLEKLKIVEKLEKLEENMHTSSVHIATTNLLLVNIDKTLTELKDAKVTQNGRISKLENWQAKILGALGVMGLGMPVIIYIVIKSIK